MMLEGSCLCRAINYSVEEEIPELILCHCSFCRKATGSAFSVNARVHQENVTLQSGDDKLVSLAHLQGKNDLILLSKLPQSAFSYSRYTSKYDDAKNGNC